MIKSVLLAAENKHNNKIFVKRIFDITNSGIVTLSNFTSDYPEITQMTVYPALYNELQNQDIMIVNWEVDHTIDGMKINVREVVKNEELFEILDFESRSSNELKSMLINGFNVGYRLTEKFFIKTGRSNDKKEELVLCETKYFKYDNSGFYKLRESYQNKPIISFPTYMIETNDILNITPYYSGFSRTRYLYRWSQNYLNETSKFYVDDRKRILSNYVRTIFKNRKTDLGLTHKQCQFITSKIDDILKEENITEYMIGLGYDYEIVESSIEELSKIIKDVILEEDNFTDQVRKIILESDDIVGKYYPEIEKKFERDNEEKISQVNSQISLKMAEKLSLEREAQELENEKAKLFTEIATVKNDLLDAEKEFDETKKKFDNYEIDFKDKVIDYILNNQLLNKIINKPMLEKESKTSINSIYKLEDSPHVFKGGEYIERKAITDNNAISLVSTLALENLTIKNQKKKQIAECIKDIILNKMSFIVDSSNAKDFATFLSLFIGVNTISTLYVNNDSKLSTLKDIMPNTNNVVLVKNALSMIDTKYVDYLIENYDQCIFVFSIENVSLLKYMPKHIWNNLFYLYYDLYMDNRFASKPKNYYEIQFNKKISFSDNIEVIASELNLELDEDENVLVNNALKRHMRKFNVISDINFNAFYIPYLVLLLNSYGINLSDLNIQTDNSMHEYVSSILKI